MAKYSKESKRKLDTCIKPLRELFTRVLKHYDHSILSGLRDKATQDKAFSNNASKVKWPNSKHNGVAPDYAESYAVDAAPSPIPLGWGDINATAKREISLQWKERVKFYQFAKVVQYEWAKMQEESPKLKALKLTWGGDWDGDDQYTDNTFDDLVHFQLDEVEERKEKDFPLSDETEAKEEDER